ELGTGKDRLRDIPNLHIHQTSLNRVRKSLNPLVHFRTFKNAPSEVRRIRTLLRELGIDLVQVCGLVNPHAAIAARLEGVPVVWQLLSTYAPMWVRAAFGPLIRVLSDVIMSTGHGVVAAHPFLKSARTVS